MPDTMIEQFNPFSKEFQSNPYPVYERYREEDPVHWGESPAPGFPGSWYIFSYEHVKAILKDSRRFKNERPEVWNAADMPESHKPYFEAVSNWLLFRDPPVHTRHRRLLAEVFSRSSIGAYRGDIEDITNELVSQLVQSSQPEMVEDFFSSLPVLAISKIMGLEVKDVRTMRHYTDTLTKSFDFRTDLSVFAKAADVILELSELVLPQIESRRTDPADDLLTYLVTANRDGHFSDQELVYMVMLLLVAGFETTINQLGNGFVALMNHREQWEQLSSDPSLIPNAVDELTRFDCPLQTMSRVAREDVQIGGKQIRAGDDVSLVFGSTNRDPAIFNNPDELDIRRSNAGDTLTFGYGIHYCIGAQLSILEITVALQTLAEQCPGIRLDDNNPVTWRKHIGLRGPASIPVIFRDAT